MRHIKATGNIWEVRQDFLRLGKPVHVYAAGVSRQDAINRFERAKYWADQPDAQPFKALYDVLWNGAGVIDKIMRNLK